MNDQLLRPFIESVSHIAMCGVVVLKDGDVIAHHQWQDEFRMNQYSASKSFTATAVAMAGMEGRLKLSDKVLPFFENRAPKNVAPQWEEMTVEHLLTMSLGHEKPLLMGSSRSSMPERDWVKYVFEQPFAHRPGEKFLYNNAGPYLAGRIVEKLYNQTLVDFLMPRLFEPLDIYLPTWELDPSGHVFGAGGLMLSVSELARFGQLYLQKGEWNGTQLFPKEWADAVSKKKIDTEKHGADREGYSYQFWMSPYGSYRADGKYGQYSIICPDKNAVIAINAYNTHEEDSILNYVWEHLYPAI